MDLESGCLVTWLVSQGDRELTGSQKLKLALLQDCAFVLQRKRNASHENGIDEFTDALEWVDAKYRSRPGCSFEAVCHELEFEVSLMHRAMHKIAASTEPRSGRFRTMRGKMFGNFRTVITAKAS